MMTFQQGCQGFEVAEELQIYISGIEDNIYMERWIKGDKK